MKARLIIDCLGPNPDHAPPLRSQFPHGPEGDEAHADAKALYDVPHSIIIPAGTVVSGPDCWVHCWEDNEGIEFENRTGLPVRVGPGTVRAEPADAACQAKLDRHLQHVAATRKWPIEKVRSYLADLIAKAKARHQERTSPSVTA